jgi:hypothetical protein
LSKGTKKFSHYLILTDADLGSDKHMRKIEDVWNLPSPAFSFDEENVALRVRTEETKNEKAIKGQSYFLLEKYIDDVDILKEEIEGLRK